MKKALTLLGLFVIVVFLQTSGQNVGVNDDGSAPDGSAMLDVKSTTRGLLPPRVALTATNSASPVTSPATGLVVYNTATAGTAPNDVTPGYYFWSGSWTRLSSGTFQLNEVSKPANATLLKTENLVLASGNSTMTLPVVTSADNGLAITIKNVGTYTNLITVTGNGGATIDGLATTSLLTRWQSNTYVVNGTNWVIKEKQSRHDNIYEVSEKGSFVTLAEVFSFLTSHAPTQPITIELGSGTYTVSSTLAIGFNFPVTIEGVSYGETTINFTGVTGPVFSCTKECYFKSLLFTTSVAVDCLLLNGTATYHEVTDCTISGFTRGINITGNDFLWLFNCDINNCSTAGVEFNETGTAAGSILKISETDFTNDGIGIYLHKSTGAIVSIINTTFYCGTSGQIGISYDGAAFNTTTAYLSMFITNNAWNNYTGSFFFSGFDFTLSRDARIFLENNAGIESEKPHCKINVLNNTTVTTTITTANTWYKANWTNTSSYTCKFTISNNSITYLPVNKRDMFIIISGNLSNSQNPRTVGICIVKNGVTGTHYGETQLRVVNANQPYQFSTVVYLPDAGPADYFEVWCTSSTNGDVLTFQDVNWFTDTQ
ncbi:MAG: hypothetical protein NTW10_10595 [Bacteroidetes bacterium]|nr:hypothetical protein [Bacteroidota bacterium]